MHPLLRLWAYAAAGIALLLLVRGAWAAAIACLVLSPAPALLLSSGPVDGARWSRAWLGSVAVAILVIAALVLAAAATEGLPEVHELRAALRGG